MDWQEAGVLAAIAVAAYAVGSFPSAFLIGRLRAGIDMRTAGEGNVGARNVFHEVGHRWGIVVFFLDVGKGALVALLLRDQSLTRLAVGATFLIIGHAYPVWLRFLGGKGVAAAGGFTVALMPLAALIGGAASGVVWLATHRFLPTVVTVIVGTLVTAPFLDVPLGVVAVALGAFVLTALKRVIDEPRMREIEAETGWDRAAGGTAS